MNSLFGRVRASRLISTFTILVTLTAGILIGSVIAHGVKGQEQKVDSSDATPLKIPNPVVLSSTFATISKQVVPAVVNINTESLPNESPRGGTAAGCAARPRPAGRTRSDTRSERRSRSDAG